MGEQLPRLLLCAAASGSGKTTMTCALLQAMKDKGLRPTAFKCGPDYIDPLFHREGTSVYLEQPVSFAQAALGAELEIPTIDGNVKYTMPEGTQTGTTFRLRGKGIPSLNGRGRGDQYVTVKVQVPTNLNKEQKDALREFARTMGDASHGGAPIKNFFENLGGKKKK